MRYFTTTFFFFFFGGCVTTASAQNFRLQIAAYAEPAAKDYFRQRGVQEVMEERTQGMYRYFHPQMFKTRLEAGQVVAALKSKGFAYPVIIDVEVDRLLAETRCPRVRNGLLVVQDTAEATDTRIVYFEGKSEALPEAGKTELLQAIAALKSHPKWTVKLAGYTDNEGDSGDNMDIAANRSRAVRDFMIAKGIRPDRIHIDVLGEAGAAAPHQNVFNEDIVENRRWNRRVTVMVHDEQGRPVKIKR
jgi:outer membrane protein OmpA-like peptidoglycan-associated protein